MADKVRAAVVKTTSSEVEKLLSEESQRKIERVRQAGTAAISFRVLSALAEGANRVAARAVPGYPDARLDAVFPLALEDYLDDSATEEWRMKFEELLRRCERQTLPRTRHIQDPPRYTDILLVQETRQATMKHLETLTARERAL
jgi:hypothetical protein